MNGIILNLSVAVPRCSQGIQLLPRGRHKETFVLMNADPFSKVSHPGENNILPQYSLRNKILLMT